MSESGSLASLGTTALSLMFLLGAYHGVNPGMGWLFAVALGMQERTGRAVGRSLLPIALGHTLAVSLVVLVAVLAQAMLPLGVVKALVASILLGFGIYCLIRRRHPRWGGMQVGFRDLAIWSFLMASAHGAGFMVLPVLLGASGELQGGHQPDAQHAMPPLNSALPALTATLVHTAGYLLVTVLVAWLVYRKLGLALLRKAWFNLDLVWAVALIVTGLFTVVI